MKKDIPQNKVEDVAMAVVKEDMDWYVYLLNLRDNAIANVLISSKGYGKLEGEKVKTSTLRHYFELVNANDFAKVELIKEEVFGLSNEYWVSFYIGREIYDKKYVFVAESIIEENLSIVPILDKPGVVII